MEGCSNLGQHKIEQISLHRQSGVDCFIDISACLVSEVNGYLSTDNSIPSSAKAALMADM